MSSIQTPVSYSIIKSNHQNLLRTKYVALTQEYSITLEEAKEVYAKIVELSDLEDGDCIKSIEIDLTKYAYYTENGCPEFSHRNIDAHEGMRKKATYNAEENELVIWESSHRNNFKPIYSNANGIINKDRAALSDSLQ